MSTRILLVDDHQLMRQGLAALLQQDPDWTLVGQAENGRDAIAQVAELRPRVVIMDIAMPDMNGIEATRRIAREWPQTRVIALSVHHDKRLVREMLHAGAAGFLLKECAFAELAQAIREVLAGRVFLSPAITGDIVRDYLARPGVAPDAGGPELTPREREVLQLIAEGRSAKEIAAALEISVKTVETFRSHIMQKLQLFSVAELTKYAIRAGLTALD